MLSTAVGLLALMAADADPTTTTPAARPHSLFDPVPQEQMRPLVGVEAAQVDDEKGHQSERDVAAVVAEQVVFEAHQGVVADGAQRIAAQRHTNGRQHQLQVGRRRQPDLQVDAHQRQVHRTGGAIDADDAHVHLELQVAGVDGDRRLGEVGAVGGLIVPLEGGLIVPFSFALPADFGIASMVQLEVNHDGLNWQPGAVVSASLGHPLPVDGFGVYLESAALLEPTLTDSRLLASGGVTWGVTPDIQLDAGTRLPVVGNGGAWEGFVGISIRR